MARRSLRPELNRIRAWVRQGRTDAWIAHQLDVTVQQIQTFKREHDLEDGSAGDGEGVTTVAFDDDEIDLRAEDDALIAAELEAAETRRDEEEAAEDAEDADGSDGDGDGGDGDGDGDEDSEGRPKARRRGRRGGRRRGRGKSSGLEATFDHGEEGYGLWLDPAVQDDPVYAEYWAGHRPVEVTVEEDQIVIRRSGDDGESSE
jgi:hypothetical protein